MEKEIKNLKKCPTTEIIGVKKEIHQTTQGKQKKESKENKLWSSEPAEARSSGAGPAFCAGVYPDAGDERRGVDKVNISRYSYSWSLRG